VLWRGGQLPVDRVLDRRGEAKLRGYAAEAETVTNSPRGYGFLSNAYILVRAEVGAEGQNSILALNRHCVEPLPGTCKAL